VRTPYGKKEDMESALEGVEGLDFEDINRGLNGDVEDSDLERSNV
jgi:hypothetical protein